MKNQNNQINNIGKFKSKFWKFTLMFFAVIIGIFVLYIAGMWAFKAYQQWQGEKKVENLAQVLKQFEADDYAKAMADTYGGKTPQETLQMYIDAIEKGDYELASKYFIGDMQEEWENNLIEIDRVKKINTFLKPLKEIKKNNGYFSSDEKIYTIEKPIFIEFKIYPNGIWKIIEI